MTDSRDTALALVILTHAIRTIKPALDQLRATSNSELRSRETVVAVSPLDGSELGHITRTNPDPVAEVEDEAALMAWLQDNMPDALYDESTVNATPEEVIDVLRAHAPHLLGDAVRITAHDLSYLLKKSESDNKPAAPGIRVRRPNGTTNVYPAKNQGPAIEAVIRSGQVTLAGTVVVPQIEGAVE